MKTETKKDYWSHRMGIKPACKCDLCTIGIGITMYPAPSDEDKLVPFKHMYDKPLYLTHKGRKFTLDEDCYRKVTNNPRKLEELWLRKDSGKEYDTETDE